ncbi:Gfo/Idh/MocA family protein [Noviherbaspirillum saxi]|uniref:Gfo/Idh/MocA family oxidoreductase n=1 Tax=Noviherbaspirillum saxi TaxID=2320863 RepID=A0A3A3FG69_9BURK|nr:Gfo/Idh/MocA family oxidoreductase [Noviherbaspirillum saxi]RJF92180.1 gfo/Idh/MocA family oxidoreductase [Noviherbaspirillum saxi]
MSKLRIGVIGAGMAFAPHAKSLQESGAELEVVTVVARSEASRNKVREQYGFAVSDSPDAVWNDRSIDAVMILTPPNTHHDLVCAAAQAGKHILLEKPLDVSLSKARALVEVCERNNVLLGAVFQHRFRESSVRLRDVFAQGELGDIVSISIQVPWWRPQSYYDVPGRGTLERDGGGVLLTQAIHTIDLALSFAGTVESVFAYAATSAVHRMETEDLVAASLRFKNGAIGTLHASTACYPGYAEQIRIAGTKGSATLEGDALAINLFDGRQILCGSPSVQGGGADPMAFSHQSHCALLRAFVQAVRSQSAPVPSGRDALRVHVLIEAMLRSAREARPVMLADC